MNPAGNILVLGSTKEKGQLIAGALATGELMTVVASGVGDAIHLLRRKPFDLLLVSANLERGSSVEFLSKAREFVPLVLRGIHEDTPLEGDLREIVNKVLPCVFLKDPIDTAQVESLIESHRKLLPKESGNPDAVYTRKDLVTFKARITHLERENKRLNHEVNRYAPKQNLQAWMPRKLEEHVPASAKQGVVAAASEPKGEFTVESLLGSQAPPQQAPAVKEKAAGIDHLREAAPQPEEQALMDPKVAEFVSGLDNLMDKPDIRLPVLPAIGMEVQQLVANENTSYEQIAEKVELDPSMSARILEVANSPLYAGTQKIQSIQNAISRIGIRETRNILQAVVAEGLFKVKDKELSDLLNNLWMHSLAVAYANEILAKALFIPESSDFFMMGLLHDIGKLLIVHLTQEGVKEKMWTRKDITVDFLQEVFMAHHNVIGLRLMEKWEYPDPFHSVVELHDDDDKVYLYDEPVVVTYYSNLLSRKIGLSLMPHVEELLDNKQIAQSLNMSDEARTSITDTMMNMVDKIRDSYLK